MKRSRNERREPRLKSSPRPRANFALWEKIRVLRCFSTEGLSKPRAPANPLKDETETPSALVGTAAIDNSESNLPAPSECAKQKGKFCPLLFLQDVFRQLPLQVDAAGKQPTSKQSLTHHNVN